MAAEQHPALDTEKRSRGRPRLQHLNPFATLLGESFKVPITEAEKVAERWINEIDKFNAECSSTGDRPISDREICGALAEKGGNPPGTQHFEQNRQIWQKRFSAVRKATGKSKRVLKK